MFLKVLLDVSGLNGFGLKRSVLYYLAHEKKWKNFSQECESRGENKSNA